MNLVKSKSLDKPVASKPAVRKPAVRKPAVRKPAVRKQAVPKPVMGQQVVGQTVMVNINTEKTQSKRQPRKTPIKPKVSNSDIATNPLYYPSVIHSIQQSPQYTMQPNPQEVKDAIREAIKNITHAASKDQYLEQLQHTNDLERQPKTKAETQPEANVETPIQPE